MAFQEEKITRDIDYTIEADFAGDESPNQLIRHHYSYHNKYSIDTWNSINRIFYSENSPERQQRLFGLVTDVFGDKNDNEYFGENSFFMYPEYIIHNNISCGKLDDGDKYNDKICDDFINCHHKTFDSYPTELTGSDPWMFAFGDGQTCDCCGDNLNPINSVVYGICDECNENVGDNINSVSL